MTRRLLVVLVSFVALSGAVTLVYVLLQSLQPSESSRVQNTGYFRVDGLAPGAIRRYVVGRSALLVYRPTKEALADLDELNDHVWDASRRSFISKLGIFVYLDQGTHLGCVLKEVPKLPKNEYRPQWRGGLLETCGDASYDYAGR
jgi:hypothetical protein